MRGEKSKRKKKYMEINKEKKHLDTTTSKQMDSIS